LLLYSYHTYVQCKPRSVSPFGFALIHRSAWKGNSPKFAKKVVRNTAIE
jgi:hypothetical protein